MEITARQFGRLEAVGYALRKYAEKNDVGTVLVGTLEEVLHEIEAADDLHELDGFLPPLAAVDEEEQIPATTANDQAATSERRDTSKRRVCRSDSPTMGHRPTSEAGLIEDMRVYAFELQTQGAGVVAMLRLVKEHFGLDSARFAALLHVRKQSLSDALNRGAVSKNLLARVADFFGDGKRAASDRQ